MKRWPRYVWVCFYRGRIAGALLNPWRKPGPGTTWVRYRLDPPKPAKKARNPKVRFRTHYEAILAGLPDHIRQGLLDGSWTLTPGKVLAPGHGFNSERSQRVENGGRP